MSNKKPYAGYIHIPVWERVNSWAWTGGYIPYKSSILRRVTGDRCREELYFKADKTDLIILTITIAGYAMSDVKTKALVVTPDALRLGKFDKQIEERKIKRVIIDEGVVRKKRSKLSDYMVKLCTGKIVIIAFTPRTQDQLESVIELVRVGK
jgi:hypothetical protein